MFSRLERKVAFRYLWAKRRGFGSVVSWVSLIGITLGVATLIVVMSVNEWACGCLLPGRRNN